MDREASIIYGFEVNSKDDKELLDYARAYSDDTIYFADIYSVGDGYTYYIGNEIDSTSDGTDIGYLLQREFGGEDIYSYCVGRYENFFKTIKDNFCKTPSLYMFIK